MFYLIQNTVQQNVFWVFVNCHHWGKSNKMLFGVGEHYGLTMTIDNGKYSPHTSQVFKGCTECYWPSFSLSIYGPSAKHTGHKSKGKMDFRNLQTKKMRLVRCYLYCASDEFNNDFCSGWMASNFWLTSKAKQVNLGSLLGDSYVISRF